MHGTLLDHCGDLHQRVQAFQSSKLVRMYASGFGMCKVGKHLLKYFSHECINARWAILAVCINGFRLSNQVGLSACMLRVSIICNFLWAGKRSRQATKQARKQGRKNNQASKEANKQGRKQAASKQASRQQASKQAKQQTSREASKPANKQAGKQISNQANKQESKQAIFFVAFY